MSRRARSARGQIVDFDLLKIKEQIATSPVPIDVKQRQDFVERRLRRRANALIPTPTEPTTEQVEDSAAEDSVAEEASTTKKATTKKVATKVSKQPARKPIDDK